MANLDPVKVQQAVTYIRNQATVYSDATVMFNQASSIYGTDYAAAAFYALGMVPPIVATAGVIRATLLAWQFGTPGAIQTMQLKSLTVGGQSGMTFTLMNSGSVVTEYFVRVQFKNASDGSTVGESGRVVMGPSDTQRFGVTCTLPGSPGSYALNLEMWKRDATSQDTPWDVEGGGAMNLGSFDVVSTPQNYQPAPVNPSNPALPRTTAPTTTQAKTVKITAVQWQRT